MASFKIWFLVLRTFFALSLIASAEVSPQNINDRTAGKGVEEGKYPGGGYGGYPGGGYAGGGYGGYRGGGRGGYGGRGSRGGYCRYGRCREYRHGGCHRCCGHANEVPDTEFQEKPKN